MAEEVTEDWERSLGRVGSAADLIRGAGQVRALYDVEGAVGGTWNQLRVLGVSHYWRR